jgi:predicted RNA binding protein YcfA (HicA-like mRNA interferase family)
MPKLPRDLDAEDLVRALIRFGYKSIRQTGSHIRLETSSESGNHRITIPNHSPIKIGTLKAILSDLCRIHKLEMDDLLKGLGL